MRRFLLMQESRVLLDEAFGCEPLGVKLCMNRQIVKQAAAFQWSQDCHRWQANSQLRFEHSPQCPLELELFLSRGRQPVVICQGTVSPAIFERHLNEEVKILLSYDGLVTGWLYCYFSVDGEEENSSQQSDKFLSMQKINLAFLEEIEEQIKIKIQQNNVQIYEKVFKLNQRSKTLFPNLKKSVRLSDVFKIQITLDSLHIKPIMFLVDNIKRGKNTTFQAWLRNKHKNRVGNVFIEYYMQNLFLENERQLRTRKALHPQSLEYAKTIAAKKIKQKQVESEALQEKGRKNTLMIKRRIEEADKRIFKINNSINIMMLQIKNNQGALPCLTKTKATFNYADLENLQGNNEKLTYCCEQSEQ